MIRFLVTISISLALTIAAAPKKKGAANKKLKPSFSKLGTDFEFSGARVMGKYQQAGEGNSVVENEKLLEPLVQPRKEFKDRMKSSVRWNQ